MKSQIMKVNLSWLSTQEVEVPNFARSLSVKHVGGKLVLFTMGNPEAPTEKRTVRIIKDEPMGVMINSTFVGTVVKDDEAFHVFVKD